MDGSRHRGLVVLQAAAAVGIVAWWIYWFASGADHAGTRCGLAYERRFPVPDLILAGFLGTTAWAFATDRPSRSWLGLVAAGMAFSLATLDTSHNLLTGGFDGSMATALRKAVFAVVNAAVGIWTLVALHGDPPAPPEGTASATLGAVVLAGLVAVGFVATGDGCHGALALSQVAWACLVGLLALRTRWELVALGAFAHGLGVWLAGLR